MTIDILAFSLTSWFHDAWGEMARYMLNLNTWQWGIVSACAVVFGFLCLKGTGDNR